MEITQNNVPLYLLIVFLLIVLFIVYILRRRLDHEDINTSYTTKDVKTNILRIRQYLDVDRKDAASVFIQAAHETSDTYEYCLQNLKSAEEYFENDFLDILLQYCCCPFVMHETSEREQRDIPLFVSDDDLLRLINTYKITSIKAYEFLLIQLKKRKLDIDIGFDLVQ